MDKKKVFLVSGEQLPLKALLGQIVAEEVEVELALPEVFEQLSQLQELKAELERRQQIITELHERLGEMDGMPDFLLAPKAFTQELDREVSRCERYQQPVSCCYIKIDRFDAHLQRVGKEGGERLFVDLAEQVRRILRKSDVMARVDTDVLAVVLPQTDGPGAVAVAEKIRAHVEPFQFTGIEDTPVTISASVVTFPRYGILGGEDVMRLCAYTLTHAVREGGNQVSVA